MEYYVVGYGSLMSHKSLSSTIPDRHFTPVIVKGYRRVFNILDEDSGHDVLNLVKSRKSFFNGVLFQVDDAELTRIKTREEIYNLESAYAYDFLSGKRLCKCVIVTDQIVAIDRKGRTPDRDYFVLCREAAYHISRRFGECWDKTTYTSDCKSVLAFLRKNKAYDTIK